MPSQRFRRVLTSLSLGLAVAAAHAAAPQQAPSADEDSAAQQKLTEQYIANAFDNIDTNKDGKLDKAEFHAFMLKYLARQRAAFERDFDAADTDHDGKLSKAEVQATNLQLYSHFDDVDANHDGYLSKAEIRAAIRERQMQVALHGSADDEAASASSK
jgi:Ca2+-binding EF-hand superfamily protein